MTKTLKRLLYGHNKKESLHVSPYILVCNKYQFVNNVVRNIEIRSCYDRPIILIETLGLEGVVETIDNRVLSEWCTKILFRARRSWFRRSFDYFVLKGVEGEKKKVTYM